MLIRNDKIIAMTKMNKNSNNNVTNKNNNDSSDNNDMHYEMIIHTNNAATYSKTYSLSVSKISNILTFECNRNEQNTCLGNSTCSTTGAGPARDKENRTNGLHTNKWDDSSHYCPGGDSPCSLGRKEG
jgi:hypothetical protein